MNPNPKPIVYNRFTVASTLSGWEVADADGRAVTPSFDDATIASNVKDSLNTAAANGPRALVRALGAVEDADLVIA